MAAWVLSAASSCFLAPVDCAARRVISWFPMDEPLRSGNRPKPKHWKSDGSTDVEETSAEEDQDWNDDSDDGWTIDTEDHSSLSGGSVCALVASDGQAPLRRSKSEIDWLVSEEVNQTFVCWKEDFAACAVSFWTNCFWPTCVTTVGTRNSISLLVACFEESERKTSEEYRKVFAQARFALPCAALCDVGDVCLVCSECVPGDAEGFRVQVLCGCSECRSCVVVPNDIDFACISESSFMSHCRVLR